LAMFAAGLVIAGVAPDIVTFLIGRVAQGLGGGAVIVAAYVVVARTFPAELRPRVFAALAGAWVVPALVGPAVAGLIADASSWRWVFLGLAPLAAAGVVLLLPSLRGVPRWEGSTSGPRLGVGGAIVLSGGLLLLQTAGQRHDPWSLPLVAAGLLLLLPPLQRLLPDGAFRLRSGLPSAVVLRGVIAGAFFGAEAYLPLALTRLHGGSPTEVGIPLTVGALGWTCGSWWQGRHANRTGPLVPLRAGFCLVAVGVGSLALLAVDGVSLWAALPMWVVAGMGMGLAMPTISVLTLSLSPDSEQGANSSALQVSDMVGSILGIALAATVVAALGLGRLDTALLVVDPALAAVALLGALVCSRAVAQPAAKPPR